MLSLESVFLVALHFDCDGCFLSVEVLRWRLSQEKMHALEAQVKQLGFQAAQDCERLTKDRTLTLQLLHKVSALGVARGNRRPARSPDSISAMCLQEQERLCGLEKRYQALTGGRSFLKPSSSTQEVSGTHQRRTRGNVLPSSFFNLNF